MENPKENNLRKIIHTEKKRSLVKNTYQSINRKNLVTYSNIFCIHIIILNKFKLPKKLSFYR